MFELNLFTSFLLLVLGFILLCKAADLLVDGAVAIASHLGVSPMIIGLTVVSVGTSAPEVAASVAAATSGNGSIAIGNVMGSNIANLALIGGLCAIIRPISVNIRMLKVELPVMILAILLLLPLMLGGVIGRIEGAILLLVFLGLLIALIKNARSDSLKDVMPSSSCSSEVESKHFGFPKSLLFIGLGLLGLTVGAKLTLVGAVYIGHWCGMSQAVIGLTIIAIGTSLPELITCLAASYKKQDDISTGNLVGSNIFNTLLVIGVASLTRPLNVEKILLIRDYPVMAGVSIVFIALAIWNRAITRGSGVILLVGYVVYMSYLLISKSS